MKKMLRIFLFSVIFLFAPATHAQELVKDIVPGVNGSQVFGLLAVGDRVYFRATTPESGSELWVSDGTTDGTRMVIDIASGDESSDAEPLESILNTLFFSTTNPGAVWTTKGRESTTMKLAEFGPGLVRTAWELSGKVFFVVKVTPSAQSLWYTDGTPAGTKPVTGSGSEFLNESGPFFREEVAVHQGSFYFTSSNNTGRHGLWKISPPNMTPVNVFSNDFTHVLYLYSTGSQLYFLSAETQVIHALWKSDGTLNGTSKIAEFTGGTHASDARFIGSDDTNVYFRADDGIHGLEPWVSNGTSSGSSLLADIVPGPDRSHVWDALFFGGKFFFATNDNSQYGSEPWVTDGTPEGTRLYRDVNWGPQGSEPNYFTKVRDRMVYRAQTDQWGSELWVSNGIKGDGLVDINPGPASGSPRDLTAIDEYLYFSATHKDYGSELWKLNVNSIPVTTERANSVATASSNASVYPNPSPGTSMLRYEVATSSAVQISLYDMIGRRVTHLYDGHRTAGTHTQSIDMNVLPPGVYLLRIQVGSSIQSRKVVRL